MTTEEHELLVAVNVSVDGSQKMVGFEVSINGRFWVSTEVAEPDTPTESALGSLKGDTLDQPIPQAAPAKHSVLLSNTDLVVLRG